MTRFIQLDSGTVYADDSGLAQAGLLNHALARIEAAMEPERAAHPWYIEDDNGEAGLSYHNGPASGCPYAFDSRAEAERAIDQYGLDRGIFCVTDIEPTPEP